MDAVPSALSQLVSNTYGRANGGIFRRFRRVFELNDEESTDVELSSLSEFRSKLINGTGRAVLVEDTRACNDKRVLKFVSDPHLRQFYHTLTTLQRHPHLCHVHEVIAVDEDSVAIVQQFASHGSLREVLSYLPSHALSEENARLLFQQLVLAVDYLVKEGVNAFAITLDTCFLHRDGCFRPHNTSTSAHRLAAIPHHRHAATTTTNHPHEMVSLISTGGGNHEPTPPVAGVSTHNNNTATTTREHTRVAEAELAPIVSAAAHATAHPPSLYRTIPPPQPRPTVPAATQTTHVVPPLRLSLLPHIRHTAATAAGAPPAAGAPSIETRGTASNNPTSAARERSRLDVLSATQRARHTQHFDLSDQDLRLVLDPRPMPLGGAHHQHRNTSAALSSSTLPTSTPHSNAPHASPSDINLLRHPILYSAPEILQPHAGRAPTATPGPPTHSVASNDTNASSNAAAVWSMGVVLHCMLTGSFPFVQGSTWAAATRACCSSQGIDTAVRILASDILHAPLGGTGSSRLRGLSPQAVSLLEQLLHFDPAQRLKLEQVLHNPWMMQRAPLGGLAFNESLVAMGRRAG